MIDLTPLDIRKKKGDFARGIRGYDTSAVDHFLDLAADRMEELVREGSGLRQRVAELAEALDGFRQREQAMNSALVSAQQLGEELRAQAIRESDLVVREARAEGERIMAEAKRQARDAAESMRRIQAGRVRFLRGFRALVERQLEEIEVEEERAREAGWSDAVDTK
ncbi:MAG: DivIVA domain-containing protein [Gemmatimonadetes bacterium]|nr:DivIVA domain-containing protein [Gemmatimonadota bacterium]